MDPRRAFPAFYGDRVVFEDDDLLVVDKPAGVPSQAADPSRPDDLVTRLKIWLAERDKRKDPYLGVHQRLDQETSGLCLFTKRPEANAGIARQFETRALVKTYAAAVSSWPAHARDTKLDDALVKGDDGRMRVLERSPRRGGGRGASPGQGARNSVRAVTHVRVQKRVQSRALLSLTLETGRTHQARVQLAHARAPIAGDALYEGPPAPRLLLHASDLSLQHPRTGKRLELRAPLPGVFEAWLLRGDPGPTIYDDAPGLRAALGRAMERRWGLAWSAELAPARRTTAYRLVHEEGDALPGLAVDVYDGHLVAQLYVGADWESEARRARVLDALGALGFDGVYLKFRPKQANVLVDTRREDLAPAHASRGEDAPPELEIREEDAPYQVRLGDGLSTGLFLDQRDNRRFVREGARGKSVLNLFAYTCGFSIAAALGGASRTVSVDASVVALERGRAGFERFGLLESGAAERHAFVAEDAFAWLGRAARKSERFDLIVLDPPSYSSTKKRRFSAESDYGDLVAQAAAVLSPGGLLVACCNHRGLRRAKLRRMIGEGMRAAGREPLQIKDLPSGLDFPPPPGKEPFMKSFLVRV